MILPQKNQGYRYLKIKKLFNFSKFFPVSNSRSTIQKGSCRFSTATPIILYELFASEINYTDVRVLVSAAPTSRLSASDGGTTCQNLLR